MFLRNNQNRTLCIPNIKIDSQNAREIVISHAHSILAHLGPRKTMAYLRDNVWWPKMNDDVKAYCNSCSVCAANKSPNHKPYGKLHTLEILKRPWDTIGIDFVGPLPESSNLNGTFDMIMTVIDHLTGMTHLVPVRQNYKA